MTETSLLLPTYHSHLIGRANETAAVIALLRDPAVRLVTLLGDSGAGKTRLALEIATAVADDFPDGAVFVALAPVTDPRFVLPTIAAALGLQEQAHEGLLATLQHALRDRRLLLLLDNVEQVVAARAEITGLLEATNRLKILLTSQVALDVAPETIYPLPPLNVPADAAISVDEARQFAAIALFADRMKVVQPRFELSEKNLPAVIDICRRLKGFPLAIEIVAAHSTSLSPQDLLVLLRNHLAMQSFRKTTALSSRDEILGPVLDWCYSQLPAPLQLVFRRAGVFFGGWTAEAIGAICSHAPVKVASMDDALELLALKRLVQKETLPGQAVRYVMLDAVRAYTEGLLKRLREWQNIAGYHADVYLALAAQAKEGLEGDTQGEWLKRLDSEIHNLRAALGWCQSAGRWGEAAGILCKLDRYWLIRGLNSEAQHWTRLVLANSAAIPPALHAEAAKILATTVMLQGDFAAAREHLQTSLDIYTTLEQPIGQLRILNNLGVVALQQGDIAAARDYFERGLAQARASNAEGLVTMRLLNNLGTVDLELGEYESARDFLNQSRDFCRQSGNLNELSGVLVNLALIDYNLGDYASARAACEEVLEIQAAIGDQGCIAATLVNLSMVLVEEGEYAQAVRRANEAIEVCTLLDDTVGIAESKIVLARIARLERRPDDAGPINEIIATLRSIDEKRYLATSLREAGILALDRGDFAAAKNHLRESVEMLFASSVVAECSAGIEALAALAVAQGAPDGDPAGAARLLGVAEANRERLRTPLPPSDRPRYADTEARINAALTPAAAAEHRAQGRAQSLAEAIQALLDA